jgi:hypothetical protein
MRLLIGPGGDRVPGSISGVEMACQQPARDTEHHDAPNDGEHPPEHHDETENEQQCEHRAATTVPVPAHRRNCGQ